MDWNDVRYFLALARTGSVRAAGERLGVSHSTVARRVEALEEELKSRLFDRSRDGYALTDAGQQMIAGAERIEGEMSALERGLVGKDERLAGTVALTCCDNYVADLVVHELVPFCQDNPDIELSFTTDSRSFDLSKREADLAIRTLAKNAQPPEHLIGKRLAPVTIANYVARAHEDRLDPEVADAAPRWISGTASKVQALFVSESSYPDVPSWGTFSSLDLMARATTEGLGIAMLPTYVGDQTGGLRRLKEPDLRYVADLWLLCHPDLRDNARFRAMRQAISNAFATHHSLFTGEA